MYDDARTESIPVPHRDDFRIDRADRDAFGFPRTDAHPLGVVHSESESLTLGHYDYDGHPFTPARDAGINGSRPCAVRGCSRWPSSHALSVSHSDNACGSRSFLAFWPIFWGSLASSCVSVLFWSVIFPWIAYLVA